MHNRREVIVNQPSLVPIAGNYDRKPRSLDREVTTVGRARGTDLCLEANEISVLHCLIYRTADGYRIRDCNSRCGTRINGEPVKTGMLRDGDIVNIGSFSFEFHLPASLFPGEAGKLDPIKVEHWKASRRQLAQLALKLRQRLRTGPTASAQEREMVNKAHLLKEKIRSYDQRFGELEAAELELAQERKQIADETEKHREHVQAIEKQLADRLAQAEHEIRDRWQDFQKRCKMEEDRIQAEAAQRTTEKNETVDDGAVQKQQEASAKIEHLEKLEEQLNRRHEQWQREQQEFTAMKEQWVKDQSKASATLEDQLASLNKQKAELMRMMGDLKKLQEDLRKQAKPDARGLQGQVERLERENTLLRGQTEEIAQLRDRLKQFEAGAGAVDKDVERQIADLRAQNELLQDELQMKEHALNAWQSAGDEADASRLSAENELLKTLLEEKDRVVEQMQEKSQQTPKTDDDLERYEAELNEFRRQLEDDRNKLNREVEILRERNKELDDAVREMEMEMSRERAELARERMRLERVREEVKGDTERLQRELAVRDSMAPVQKLRDEMMQKKAPGGKAEKPLNDRLRTMRNAIPDAPTTST